MQFDIQPIENIVAKFAEAYKQQLISDGKKATGNLINSVRGYVEYKGTILSVVIDVADYWRYVEYGRKPGKFPPIDKIRQWIKVKPVLPRPGKNGKLPTENQLAFLISRKIAKKGIPATHSLSKTVNSFNLRSQIMKELERQVLKTLRFQDRSY